MQHGANRGLRGEKALAGAAGDGEEDVPGVMDGSSCMGNGRKQLGQHLTRAVLEVSAGREVAREAKKLGTCLEKGNHAGDLG